MLKNIKKIYTTNEFSMNKFRDYSKINEYKRSFLLYNDIRALFKENLDILRYPGFLFSSYQDVYLYYNNFYKYVENVITPPRGNLTRNSKYAFIGIKPGFYSRTGLTLNNINECAWFFGPSSRWLYRLLYDLKIYPYFSNVYKECTDEENHDITLFKKEMKVLLNINPNIIFVFMGNYYEFPQIIYEMNLRPKQYKRIWHPSYIARKSSMFNFWKKQLEG